MNYGQHEINFAPNQKLPPGYRIVWCDGHEHYYWLCGDLESYMFCDRWDAYRSAWAHYKAGVINGKENQRTTQSSLQEDTA